MGFYSLVIASFIVSWYLILAQQSCYLPDGSDAVGMVNCDSSQDSVCCYPGKGTVCLTNGLCYNPNEGTTYRGACTVRDWSNTTVCLAQYCHEVQTCDVWKCPHKGSSGTVQWWCGNTADTLPCQTGINASFVSYPPGTISGPLPVISTLSTAISTLNRPSSLSPSSSAHTPALTAAPTQTFDQPIGPSTATGIPSTDRESTNTAVSGQSQPQSSRLPIAIGVGIGLPLGIAAVGFLGFLFSRKTKLSDKQKSQKSSQESILKSAIDESPVELHNNPLPHQLDDSGRIEMPGTAARIVPVF